MADASAFVSPYEPPLQAELELATGQLTVGECVDRILLRLNAPASR